MTYTRLLKWKVLKLLNAGKGTELKGKHLEDIDVNDDGVFYEDIKQRSTSTLFNLQKSIPISKIMIWSE